MHKLSDALNCFKLDSESPMARAPRGFLDPRLRPCQWPPASSADSASSGRPSASSWCGTAFDDAAVPTSHAPTRSHNLKRVAGRHWQSVSRRPTIQVGQDYYVVTVASAALPPSSPRCFLIRAYTHWHTRKVNTHTHWHTQSY
jgi:hypothetical protein